MQVLSPQVCWVFSSQPISVLIDKAAELSIEESEISGLEGAEEGGGGGWLKGGKTLHVSNFLSLCINGLNKVKQRTLGGEGEQKKRKKKPYPPKKAEFCDCVFVTVYDAGLHSLSAPSTVVPFTSALNKSLSSFNLQFLFV